MAIPYVVRKKVYVIGNEKKELWHAVISKIQQKGGMTEDLIASRVSEITTTVVVSSGGIAAWCNLIALERTDGNTLQHILESFSGVKDKTTFSASISLFA